MFKRLIVSALVVCIGLLLVPLVARAAGSPDDLDNIIFEGVIRDAADAVIAGAKVVAIHTATGIQRSAVSGTDGRFRIAVSSPGNYKLKANASGFKEEESEEISATSGRNY